MLMKMVKSYATNGVLLRLEKAVTAIISERPELHIKRAYPAVENMEPLSEKSAIIIMDLIILDVW